MRICLFTDTLNDVNGVSRFIRNVGRQARLAQRDLQLITSTRFAPPPGDAGSHTSTPDYIHNLDPLYARPMPGYPQLELVVPRNARIHRLVRALRPDIIHVSTPGPVGLLGRTFALRHRIPLVGTYHTDFPAYIDLLFSNASFTTVCNAYMQRFYRPFSRIFTRSDDYARALAELGYPLQRVERLRPGIDTDAFSTRFRDPAGEIWRSLNAELFDAPSHVPIRAGAVKVLYVGRVSVEKNLPMLTRLWKRLGPLLRVRSLDAQLLVVGDGPYRPAMQSELAGADACFLGFRHGAVLSTIYASSNLFIFPSTTDTLGQVVMEAQAAGLPVLVADQGGPKEVVDHAVTGFVLPAAGADDRWIDAMLRLIADARARNQMSIAAAAKIAPMSIRSSFEHFWTVHEDVQQSAASPHLVTPP